MINTITRNSKDTQGGELKPLGQRALCSIMAALQK
jgi:hypothetical protein